MLRSIPRWLKVLILGLILSAGALFAKEFVAFARTSAPLSRAYTSWYGLLFRGTQALTYMAIGAAMVLVADRLVGSNFSRQRSAPGTNRQRPSFEERLHR